MITLQLTALEPEMVLLAAAVLWIAAALATGLPSGRVPSDFPFMFAMLGFITILIGITEMVTEEVDLLLTIIGVLLFTLLPIVMTIKLYQSYPPVDNQSSAG